MGQEKVKEETQIKTDIWGEPVEHGGEPVHETIEKDNGESGESNKDQKED